MVLLIGLAAIKIVTFLALVHRVVSMMKLNGIIHFAKKKVVLRTYNIILPKICINNTNQALFANYDGILSKKVTFEHKEIFDDLTPSKRLLAVALHYTVLQSLISQERKI